MKRICLFFACLFVSISIFSQTYLVKNGLPVGRIINGYNTTSATFLNSFIQKISGTELPVLSHSTTYRNGDVVFEKIGSEKTLKGDGFIIRNKRGVIKIIAATDKGLGYAIVHLLEQFWRVKYYAADAITITQQKDIKLPTTLDIQEIPSFSYRQTQVYSLKADSLYKIWFRLNEPNEVFAANYWVHTFDRILPSAKYGAKNPEFYSLINGVRRPGAASQWCLSNPQLFEVVSQQIDSIFKANPEKNIISVSQNDGNNTNCTCSACKQIDSVEGSPSGSLIRFLNKLATRFPNKQFSTLAYLYSMNPPSVTKPLPNVNIMLCDIDCYREVTLPENASGRYFLKALEGWAKISDNIFLWDYGINFDNYVSPFPNLHILQANMKIFENHHVKMHFSQIGGSKGGDFSELRSYLVSKLMWHTDYNVDSLIQDFLVGYYGHAAPYLYQYIKMQEGALLSSGKPLWIYDTPITHKDGMLNAALLSRYIKLFDKAEKAVAHNATLLNRVKQQRLSLQFAALEIGRTQTMKDLDQVKSDLAIFKNTAHNLGVVYLNERNNTIADYCDLYATRYLQPNKDNLALGAGINFLEHPSKPYDKIANKAITDGLFGGSTFNESWVGWEGKNAKFVIDLGAEKTFDTVEGDFLHKLGAWIFLPKQFSCEISKDNINYAVMGKKDIDEDQSPEVKYVAIGITAPQKVTARYIRISIENIGICPSWHYGVGHPAWFFLDEIRVK